MTVLYVIDHRVPRMSAVMNACAKHRLPWDAERGLYTTIAAGLRKVSAKITEEGTR